VRRRARASTPAVCTEFGSLRSYCEQRPFKQIGFGGGAHGGIGPGLHPEQYASAALERFTSSESETPYQTTAYEQPCSHKFTGAIATHSLLLAQPYEYLFRIASRSIAYACWPFLQVVSGSETQLGQHSPAGVSVCVPGGHLSAGHGGQAEHEVGQH
jgi:hypothetical protein